MSTDWKQPTDSMEPLLEMVIAHIPEVKQLQGTPQMLITSLDFSTYTGRIAIGRLHRGVLKEGMNVTLIKREGETIKSRIKDLYVFEGIGKKKVSEVHAGDICAVTGIEGFEIGDCIADFENPEGMETIKIDEPTMSMLFTINNSPFFGKEGKFVTSRHLRDRLYGELEKNLALRIEETASPDALIVYGRGILHLSILIETMRREGYELQLGQPKVIVKEIDGKKCEPVEQLTILVPDQFAGKIIELVTMRKGEIDTIEQRGDRSQLEFTIPSRGIIGLRNNLLTVSEGEAIIAHRLKGFEPWKGEIGGRRMGSLIAKETGTAIEYSINKLQDRGRFFVEPGEDVYTGMVVGENIRPDDIVCNITITKKLTNMRASGSDDKSSIAPAIKFSL